MNQSKSRAMNKSFYLKGIFLTAVFTVILACLGSVSAQTKKEKKATIPENVNTIFQTSCMPCHGEKGGRLPATKLDFSRWAGYKEGQRVEKASAICNSVRKGTMPPKSFIESKPELVLTKEQADLVCKWADSVKGKKGKK
jgi:mono/diheme cytochrome c family protein